MPQSAPTDAPRTVSPTPEPRRWDRGLATSFRSLRHRNYRLYFIGQIISFTGSWMQTTALAWLAFALTGKSTWPALISASGILPTFLLGAWGGALADRWPKRSLIFVTQSAFLLLALLLAILVFAGLVDPWLMLAITTATGIVQAIDLPARLAFVMDLAGREDLINAVGLNSVLFNVARVCGPALGGLVLFWWGPGVCFLINAISFVAVLWALAQMDVEGVASMPGPHGSLRALADGFRYIAAHREMAFLCLLAGTTSLFGWPSMSLLPALAHRILDSSAKGYSLLLSGTGLGALAAAWTVATFGSIERRGRFMACGVALISGGLVLLAESAQLGLAVGCCALVGFGLILFLSTCQSVVQLGSREHNRGRIMGIYAMILSGAVPLGNFLAGPAADRYGEPAVLRWLGIACGGAALCLLVVFRPSRIAADGPLPLSAEAAADDPL
jgi:predicted MFS family arabinose efflux permease